MRKKLLCHVLLLAMVVTSFSFTGCGNESSNDKVEVGIVLPTREQSRWQQDEKQFKEKLDSAGFTNTVLFSDGDNQKERTNVESLIQKKIKVLIICPNDGNACGAAVEAAQEAGIKVIAYDRLITGTDAVDYYVTFDSEEVGKAQGQYLIDNAPKDKKNIPLYLYAGDDADNNSFLFFGGAWKVLQPKIADGTFVIANSDEAKKVQDKAELSREEMGKVIGQITTKWDASKAKGLAEDHLSKAGDDLKGDVCILGPNDDTSRAIATSFKGNVTSFIITGQDAEKASIQSIIDGEQSMTVFKDTRVLAQDSIDMAVDLLNDKTPTTGAEYDNEKKKVPSKQSPIVVVDKNNYQQALIDSKYYQASDFKTN